MRVDPGVPLAPLTTLGLGGPAQRLVTAYDDEEAVQAAREEGGPLLVLGGGSNVVIADEGFPGTVLHLAARDRSARRSGEQVWLEVAAGHDWDELVGQCVEDGLSGLECLAGIPGLVGATPIQNVGAYGQEVAATVTHVRAYDRCSAEVVTVTDCGFGYRRSRFKEQPQRWVVLGVGYRLARDRRAAPVRYAELAAALGVAVGERPPAARVREAVLALRRRKGMVIDPADPDTRSAGSFFTNPVLRPEQAAALRVRVAQRLGGQVRAPEFPEPDGRVKVPAGWLIEQAGFRKGDFAGPVGLSGKHALALVHRGGGSTQDLLRVARAVRDGVRAAFGVELVPEPVLVGVSL